MEMADIYAVCFHVAVMSHTICDAKLDLLGQKCQKSQNILNQNIPVPQSLKN